MKTHIYLSKRSSAIFLIILSLLLWGCEEFVQVKLPNTKISNPAIFANDQTATAATLGMYDVMQRISAFGAAGGQNSITGLAGLSADEFSNYSVAHEEIKQNNILATNANVLSLWGSLYNTIYLSNSITEGIAASTTLSPPVRDQLAGEAKFIRAFCYFYLINLFGDVPLILGTDYRDNMNASRAPVTDVYEKIVSDLEAARELLSESYPSTDRVRPNHYAASAMLARVFLYTGQWEKAEEMATEVIGNSNVYALENDLTKIFLMKSTEAIWQLATATPEIRNSWEGQNFILTFAPFFISLNPDLLEAFEDNDQRAINWIGTFTTATNTYYYSYKYKIRTGTPQQEHSIILRLSEQYLIRAEARAHLNKLTGANSSQSDLDMIRNRAGLSGTSAQTQEDLLMSILQERRVELFTEWGHRWFDLKRTDQLIEILAPTKPGLNNGDELYPIPDIEMSKAPNLRPQNPGY